MCLCRVKCCNLAVSAILVMPPLSRGKKEEEVFSHWRPTHCKSVPPAPPVCWYACFYWSVCIWCHHHRATSWRSIPIVVHLSPFGVCSSCPALAAAYVKVSMQERERHALVRCWWGHWLVNCVQGTSTQPIPLVELCGLFLPLGPSLLPPLWAFLWGRPPTLLAHMVSAREAWIQGFVDWLSFYLCGPGLSIFDGLVKDIWFVANDRLCTWWMYSA